MARKNSKTDHVLNLITGNEEDEGSTKKKKTASKKKVSVVNPEEQAEESEAIAEAVKEKLEAEQEKKTKKTTARKKIKPPAPKAAKIVVDESDKSKQHSFTYLNVMEKIVKAQVEDTIKSFDICTCDRCKADIIALSLTNLPPKYVVTDKEMSPLLNYYASKFYETVNIEIMKACTLVNAYPHHNRD